MSTPQGHIFGNHAIFSQPRDSVTRGQQSAGRRHGGNPRILFVCTANISRSSYAEIVLRHRLGLHAQWNCVSAGIPGTDGRMMDEAMAHEAMKRGISLEECQSFRSTALTRKALDRAIFVITMTVEHRNRIADEYPEFLKKVWTLDQWGRSSVTVAQDIHRLPAHAQELLSQRELIEMFSANKVTPTTAGDVTDPFRRGPEVAAQVAITIDAVLDTVSPLLVHPSRP